jgi:hypothetical protein
MLGWLRASANGDPRSETALAAARKGLDASSSGLLQRIMASRAVQEGALERAAQGGGHKTEAAPVHPAGV